MFKFFFVMFFFFILLVFLMGFSCVPLKISCSEAEVVERRVNNAVKQAVTLPTRAATALHAKNMPRRPPVKRSLQKMKESMWITRK